MANIKPIKCTGDQYMPFAPGDIVDPAYLPSFADPATYVTQTQLTNAVGYVTPEQFGTIGSGTNDNAAFSAAIATGKPVKAFGPYYRLQNLTLNTAPDLEFGANTEIRNTQASGAKVPSLTVRGGLVGTAVVVTGLDNRTTGVVDNVTIPLGELSEVFSVADVSQFAVGDTLRIFEDNGLTTETRYGTATPSQQDMNYREFITIESITGNKIKTQEFLRFPYSTARNLKVQKVNFVEHASVRGGKWTGTVSGGGGVAFEFVRFGYAGEIHGSGLSDTQRNGGSPVVFRDCWESDRGPVQAQWCLFTELTERNQSCTFGRIGGKRTQNGGTIHGGDIFCNFEEIVQDSPGDDNGDTIGLSNGFRYNTVNSFIASGSNCYGMWMRQSVDDNTFLSYTQVNGITGALYVFGNRNTFKHVKIRGTSSFGLIFGGDYNAAEVDIEVLGTAVDFGNGTVGNRATGRAISTGTGILSWDVMIGSCTRSFCDLVGGSRGLNYKSGSVENHSNNLTLRGIKPYRLGPALHTRGYTWSKVFALPNGVGTAILQVPGFNADGSDAPNGLVDIAPHPLDVGVVYRITLTASSGLADVRSEYEVLTRMDAWYIRTVYEGGGTYATLVPKLRVSGTTLEIYKDDTTAANVIVGITRL